MISSLVKLLLSPLFLELAELDGVDEDDDDDEVKKVPSSSYKTIRVLSTGGDK
jgi:hypothetical protein